MSAVSVRPRGIRSNTEKAGRWIKVEGNDEERFKAGGGKLLITSPEECATDIVDGLRHGKRRILTGNMAHMAFWMSRLLPGVYPALAGALNMEQNQQTAGLQCILLLDWCQSFMGG